jgi:hypothetical protein
MCESNFLDGVRAPLYIRGGEAASPKGSMPQEVPPPLPSSCGRSSHSSLIILVDFPLKNQEFSHSNNFNSLDIMSL